MSETRETRIKRLKMRSMRRGIKEMDMILSAFADRGLAGLSADDLDLYEALLSENDHDIYAWVSGRIPVPERYSALLDDIARGFPNPA